MSSCWHRHTKGRKKTDSAINSEHWHKADDPCTHSSYLTLGLNGSLPERCASATMTTLRTLSLKHRIFRRGILKSAIVFAIFRILSQNTNCTHGTSHLPFLYTPSFEKPKASNCSLCTRFQTRNLFLFESTHTHTYNFNIHIYYIHTHTQTHIYTYISMVAQTVNHLPARQETQVLSLDWEDPLRKEWQPTLVFLPGEMHRQRSLVG